MSQYAQIEILSFERIAFAHSLATTQYKCSLDNRGFGLYGEAPEDGGVLEIGFVEQNPVIISGDWGDFTVEENGIFIIPPHCSFSVRALRDGVHRHTQAEFLIRCKARPADRYEPPKGRCVTLPLVFPPCQGSSEIFHLIRAIACAKTTQSQRGYFEECSDFMLLIHKLSLLASEDGGTDTVSPANRRYCERAKTFISQNIHRRVTVSDVAETVGISKNYLTNVFSSSEGIPLMEYINRHKLSYMIELIRRYDYTLEKAGEAVGFTDSNYLSRIFKRYYGMTLTEYKRNKIYHSKTTAKLPKKED